MSTCKLLVPLLIASVAGAQDHAAIVGATVIDVRTGAAIPRQMISIKDGRIRDVARRSATDANLIVHAERLFAIPGLFDSHVHYVDNDSFGPMMIAHGVTFVRDMGAPTDSIVATRDQLNKGELLGPEMVCTGAIIDGVPPVWPFSEPVETEEEARAAVQKLHKAGVNQIKVYSKLKPEVYRAAVDEAKKLGLKAVGHIPAACTPADALAAGQSSVEHLSQFDRIVAALAPEDVDKEPRKEIWSGMIAWPRIAKIEEGVLVEKLKPFAQAGMYQVPTLVVMAGIGRLADEDAEKDPRLEYVPFELRSFWAGDMYKGFGKHAAAIVPHMQKMVRAMDKAGVWLAVGTDLANPYVFAGRSVHDEMRLFVDAGLSNVAALRAATINAAALLGVEKTHGTIEAGKVASLVLLRANPLEDIGNTMAIEGVFLRGKYYNREALDKLMAEVKESVASSKPTETAVKLELPGQPIARGAYTAKFQQFDAGSEDFLITKAADGYRLVSHNRPTGGMQKPMVVTVHYSPEWELVNATYKTLTESPVEVTYTKVGKTIEAKAVQGGKELPAQTIELPESYSFAAPVYAADFMAIQAARLEAGKSIETTGIVF